MSPSEPTPRAVELSPEQLLGPLNEVERKHAPACLYVAGDRRLIRTPRVSVVGTRQPTTDGANTASAITLALVQHGVTVVSGLAEGIDTIAHHGALSAGGRTLAVLGTPLDKFYPAKNRELQLQIMQKHLAISQFSPGTTVHPGMFPVRNRTMALLSHATIIVEAGEKSGTIHQGWEALRLGRPLFISEALTRRADLSWVVEMQSYGALPISASTIDILFEYIPMNFRDRTAAASF